MSKHSLESNKIAAAILLAGVIAMVSGFIADGLYTPKDAAKRGFAVEVPEVASGGSATAVAEIDIGTLLASADAARGDGIAHKKCVSCHTFENGGAHKVGPNLAGTVGGKVAGHGGYTYSSALIAHGGTWDYESLNKWLKNPGAFVKGNKMAYAGIKNDAERADVIMYLKSISTSAPALPAPKPVEAPAAAQDESAKAPAAH